MSQIKRQVSTLPRIQERWGIPKDISNVVKDYLSYDYRLRYTSENIAYDFLSLIVNPLTIDVEKAGEIVYNFLKDIVGHNIHEYLAINLKPGAKLNVPDDDWHEYIANKIGDNLMPGLGRYGALESGHDIDKYDGDLDITVSQNIDLLLIKYFERFESPELNGKDYSTFAQENYDLNLPATPKELMETYHIMFIDHIQHMDPYS